MPPGKRMAAAVLAAIMLGAITHAADDDTSAAHHHHDKLLKAVKLELWKRGVDCGAACDSDSLDDHRAVLEAAMLGGRRPVLPVRSGHCDAATASRLVTTLRGGSGVDGGESCAVAPPDIAALSAKLGPEFATAIARNEADHAADCRESCKNFYCGDVSQKGGAVGAEASFNDTSLVPPVSSHHFGEVPPEDFASDFQFPLDLIKVTSQPLFTAGECEEAVKTAESEDVHLNEYVSGKYKLGGDWIKNMPKTLRWFNNALEEKIFPTLAHLFPEVISSPEVLRAHSVAMLKYNSSHPRTDVHVDNGIIALTLAMSPAAQYEGGGTFFEHMGPDKVLPMDIGHATFRPGSVRHGGHPVTAGERYIVGAFILIEDKVEHVRRLNNQGRAARGAGDSEKAKRLFEYGLAINPHCVTCLKNLGEALMALDRPEEAEPHFRRALELTPRDSDAMYNLGGTLKALGRVDECVEVYQEAVKVNDDDWELCYNLGVALGDLKRYSEEAIMYRKALAINPEHPQSWTNLGIALALMGDTAGALEPFRRGCEADPTNADAWTNLARCYKALGKEAEAAGAIGKARKLMGVAGGMMGGAGMAVPQQAPAADEDVEDF